MQGRVADYILAVDIHTAASQRRDAVRVSLLRRCMHGAARARVSICTFVLVKQVVSQRRDAVRVFLPGRSVYGAADVACVSAVFFFFSCLFFFQVSAVFFFCPPLVPAVLAAIQPYSEKNAHK